MKDVYYIVVSSKQTRRILRRIRMNRLLDRALILGLAAFSILTAAGCEYMKNDLEAVKSKLKERNQKETADAQ